MLKLQTRSTKKETVDLFITWQACGQNIENAQVGNSNHNPNVKMPFINYFTSIKLPTTCRFPLMKPKWWTLNKSEKRLEKVVDSLNFFIRCLILIGFACTCDYTSLEHACACADPSKTYGFACYFSRGPINASQRGSSHLFRYILKYFVTRGKPHFRLIWFI